MLPAHVAEAIEEHFGKDTVPVSGGAYAHEGECEGAAFHSPRPLTLIDTSLAPDGDTRGPTALLCPNCAANLDILRRLMASTSGDLPWVVRREFGNKLRALAKKGWDYYVTRPTRV